LSSSISSVSSSISASKALSTDADHTAEIDLRATAEPVLPSAVGREQIDGVIRNWQSKIDQSATDAEQFLHDKLSQDYAIWQSRQGNVTTDMIDRLQAWTEREIISIESSVIKKAGVSDIDAETKGEELKAQTREAGRSIRDEAVKVRSYVQSLKGEWTDRQLKIVNEAAALVHQVRDAAYDNVGEQYAKFQDVTDQVCLVACCMDNSVIDLYRTGLTTIT